MTHSVAYHQVALNDFTRQAEQASGATNYALAEEMLLKAYEHAKHLYGPDHGEVGIILLHLADVCMMQGKHELAAEYMAETEKIARFYEETST